MKLDKQSSGSAAHEAHESAFLIVYWKQVWNAERKFIIEMSNYCIAEMFVLAKISHAIPTTMPSTEALSYSRNSLEIKPKFSSFLLHLEGSSSQS